MPTTYEEEEDLTELARKVRDLPDFIWRMGMVTTRGVSILTPGVGPPDVPMLVFNLHAVAWVPRSQLDDHVPDLEDDATGGLLLGWLREKVAGDLKIISGHRQHASGEPSANDVMWVISLVGVEIGRGTSIGVAAARALVEVS